MHKIEHGGLALHHNGDFSGTVILSEGMAFANVEVELETLSKLVKKAKKARRKARKMEGRGK